MIPFELKTKWPFGIAALTNFGSSLAGAACDGQPNVGEATCSEARFAPKGQVANEVSAAIPPDARSASGGTSALSHEAAASAAE